MILVFSKIFGNIYPTPIWDTIYLNHIMENNLFLVIVQQVSNQQTQIVKDKIVSIVSSDIYPLNKCVGVIYFNNFINFSIRTWRLCNTSSISKQKIYDNSFDTT